MVDVDDELLEEVDDELLDDELLDDELLDDSASAINAARSGLLMIDMIGR